MWTVRKRQSRASSKSTTALRGFGDDDDDDIKDHTKTQNTTHGVDPLREVRKTWARVLPVKLATLLPTRSAGTGVTTGGEGESVERILSQFRMRDAREDELHTHLRSLAAHSCSADHKGCCADHKGCCADHKGLNHNTSTRSGGGGIIHESTLLSAYNEQRNLCGICQLPMTLGPVQLPAITGDATDDESTFIDHWSIVIAPDAAKGGTLLVHKWCLSEQRRLRTNDQDDIAKGEEKLIELCRQYQMLVDSENDDMVDVWARLSAGLETVQCMNDLTRLTVNGPLACNTRIAPPTPSEPIEGVLWKRCHAITGCNTWKSAASAFPPAVHPRPYGEIETGRWYGQHCHDCVKRREVFSAASGMFYKSGRKQSVLRTGGGKAGLMQHLTHLVQSTNHDCIARLWLYRAHQKASNDPVIVRGGLFKVPGDAECSSAAEVAARQWTAQNGICSICCRPMGDGSAAQRAQIRWSHSPPTAEDPPGCHGWWRFTHAQCLIDENEPKTAGAETDPDLKQKRLDSLACKLRSLQRTLCVRYANATLDLEQKTASDDDQTSTASTRSNFSSSDSDATIPAHMHMTANSRIVPAPWTQPDIPLIATPDTVQTGGGIRPESNPLDTGLNVEWLLKELFAQATAAAIQSVESVGWTRDPWRVRVSDPEIQKVHNQWNHAFAIYARFDPVGADSLLRGRAAQLSSAGRIRAAARNQFLNQGHMHENAIFECTPAKRRRSSAASSMSRHSWSPSESDSQPSDDQSHHSFTLPMLPSPLVRLATPVSDQNSTKTTPNDSPAHNAGVDLLPLGSPILSSSSASTSFSETIKALQSPMVSLSRLIPTTLPESTPNTTMRRREEKFGGHASIDECEQQEVSASVLDRLTEAGQPLAPL